MALSHGLAKAGTPAEQLDTSATVTFVPGEGITKIALTVRGTVPGVDAAAFVEAAEAQGGLPGLEGARERARDHARRSARLSAGSGRGAGEPGVVHERLHQAPIRARRRGPT